MSDDYSPEAPSREQIDATDGALVLDFGTNWCGYCQAARPVVERALDHYPSVRHVRIEDGKGRPLGRTFQVKLWPTLVFLRDGRELARVVRPQDDAAIAAALAEISEP